MTISYNFIDTEHGRAFLAKSKKGICTLFLLKDKDEEAAFQEAQKRFKETQFERKTDLELNQNESLDLQGTDFQKSVWQALLEIPMGQTCSYKDIALKIGKPKAARAVGQAVGANPVSILVPCHRVLPEGGGIGGYAWGPANKKAMLEKEGINLAA